MSRSTWELVVENRGTDPSTETTVSVAGSSLLNEQLVAALDPGESRSLRMSVAPVAIGPQILSATVDRQNVVPELDETNNSRELGRTYVGELVVMPQIIDLVSPPGCTRQLPLSLENRSATETSLALSLSGETATSP